jgi:1,4-alpha-glucan branching enzyme
MKLNIVKNDPWLEPFSGRISDRHEQAIRKETKLTGSTSGLREFASGHLFFGMHRESGAWIFREWAPNADKIYLIGEFTNWEELPDFLLEKKEHGNWELRLPPDKLRHGDLYRLSVHWEGGHGDRIPAWVNRVVQDRETLIFNAQVWAPDEPYIRKNDWIDMSNRTPLIYEAHIGMASEEGRIATFNEFRTYVLPRIVKGGYNTIQLMAIQEHPYYGSFGYHVSSFFAPSSRFILMQLKMKLRVLVNLMVRLTNIFTMVTAENMLHGIRSVLITERSRFFISSFQIADTGSRNSDLTGFALMA